MYNILCLNHHSKIKEQVEHLMQDNKLPFSNIFSNHTVNQHLEQYKGQFRDRVFSLATTLSAWISQIFCSDSSCTRAVARVNAFRLSCKQKPISPLTASYCQARAKIPCESIISLAKEEAKRLEQEIPAIWLWKGRHIKLIDGSTLDMPDTPLNQEKYPQQKAQKTGCGFPIMRIVAITSLATRSILDFSMSAYQGKGTGECSLLKEIVNSINIKDIVIADGYYGTYFIICMILNRKADVIFKIHGARKIDYYQGKSLGECDHIVKWQKPQKPDWLTPEEYNNFPDFITVREVKINKRSSKPLNLVTTFIDEKSASKEELSELFKQRWNIELNLRHIKTTMKMHSLTCKSPQMVEKEIWVHILAYNFICKTIAQSALIHKKLPQQISFKGAMQTLHEYTSIFYQLKTKKVLDLYTQMLQAISKMATANRGGRLEPRAIKRRAKQYDLLNEHRKVAQLKLRKIA